jgi:hypothetical protein
MEACDAAHICEQGVDLILVLLDPSFGYKTDMEQKEIVTALQECATATGLAGTIIPVWDVGGGRMGFLAPQNFHPFFSSIDLAFVLTNVNAKLTCA